MQSYNPIKKQIAQALSAHLGIAVNAHPEHTTEATACTVTLLNGTTETVTDIPAFCTEHFLDEAEFRKIIGNPFAYLKGITAVPLTTKEKKS